MATVPNWLARIFTAKHTEQLSNRRPLALPNSPPGGQQFRFDGTLERQIVERTSAGRAIEQIVCTYQRAEDGFVEDMLDLFDRRIEADAHLRGALENRNEAVAQKVFTIEPGGVPGHQTDDDREAAHELERRFREIPNLFQTFEHQLTYNPFGWAASEMTWDVVDGLAAPVWFDNVPHRRFTFERETDRPMLRTFERPALGVPLTPGKWWWTQRRGRLIATAGLMRTACWWSTFKTLATRDWLIFAERFGIPYVTGQYSEDISDEDKDVLRQAVRDLGSDGFATFSKAAEIVINEAKTQGNVEGVHASLLGVCDNQISFLIEGATLVSSVDGPGSHALGKVHQQRYFDIIAGDAMRLGNSFEMNVGAPFVKFNGLKARPPRLVMHLGLNMSLADQVDIATKLANKLEGFEVDEEQIRAMTLLRKPREGTGLRGVEVAKAVADAERQNNNGQTN